MQATGADKRKHTRTKRRDTQELQIVYVTQFSQSAEMPAQLIDVSEGGIGVQIAQAIRVGTRVRIWGKPLPDTGLPIANVPARVVWCVTGNDGLIRAGIMLDDPAQRAAFGWKPPQANTQQTSGEFVQDYYELLQISPKALPDTIQKVYRLLAQRYHPDNLETGNAEMFKLIAEANRTLSDPEQRAAYDVHLNLHRQLRWKLFDKPQNASGIEAEKRKRQGIVTMLYTKRLRDPDQPAVTLHEMEELLGCAKEHLQFSLWYLKENGLVVRSDNGRFSITVKGVDYAESNPYQFVDEGHLLTAAADE